MFKTEQTEDFEISNNILCNFLPNEKLIYKLKLKFYLKKQIVWITTLFLTPIGFVFIILMLPNLSLFKNLFILSLSSFILFPLAFIYALYMSKAFKLFIYLTNKKIYIIKMNTYMNYRAYIVELASLQAISVQYSDHSKDMGIIEFISKNFDSYIHPHKKKSIITPPVKNVSKIACIIESIIYYYGNIEKRIENIDNRVNKQNFNEFFESEQKYSLKVYNDALILIKGNKSQKVEFDENFYLNYKKDTLIMSFFYKKSSKEFTFGPIENFLDILELIYLKFLLWKFNKDLLLHIEKMLDLEVKQRSFDFIKEISEIEEKFKPNNYSKEKIVPFSKYLNESEQIQLLYFPKKISSSIAMIIVDISLIIYFYFVIFSITGLSIETLLLFFGTFLMLIFGLISFLTRKSIKYIFTSQRIILNKQKTISFIPLEFIIGVTYCNKINHQNIEIHLKNPIKDLNLGEIIKIKINPPKKLNLKTKILSLIKTSKRNI